MIKYESRDVTVSRVGHYAVYKVNCWWENDELNEFAVSRKDGIQTSNAELTKQELQFIEQELYEI